MKFTKIFAASLLAMASIPAAAQDITAGGTVYGPDGSEVGTILEATDTYVVIDTGNNQATVGADVFGSSEQGPTISMTRAQLDEAVEAIEREAKEKLAAALVAGAAVQSSDGVAVGTVQEITDEGNVVIEREEGAFALPSGQFAVTEQGELSLRFTAAQLEAALSGSAS